MKDEIKNKGVFKLADLVPYKENGINVFDAISNDAMKVRILAFDKHTLLAEHVAPGDAIFTVLEGKAGISYKGDEHNLVEGESFVFEKGAEHSVYATERLKVALVLAM